MTRLLGPPGRPVTFPLLLLLAGFTALAAPEWLRNPDLSHGFFTPLLFWLLLREGVLRGTPRWLRAGPLLGLGRGASLAASGLLLLLGGLLAAAVGWSHAVVLFILAAALGAVLLSGLLGLADERVRLVPCNWPVLAGLGLWVLSAPLPDGTYARLTLALQGLVTSGVLSVLDFLGVPARQSGNIIELAATSVGVEEACSGIRSLLSCVFAAVFFSGWLVRRPAGRAVLIVAAPFVALGLNFVRSLLLTLLANAGHDISGFWHDATGLGLLGVAAGLLGLAASLLGPAEPPALTPEPPAPDPVVRHRLFLGGSLLLASVAVAFVLLGRPHGSEAAGTAPDLQALLPASYPGWEVSTPPDLQRFAGVLRTSHFGERYYFGVRDGEPVQLGVYVAHWLPGQASVSLVAAHTPDACWPGSGWEALPNPAPRAALRTGELALPVAEHRIFRLNRRPQHVWFWHLHDGRPIHYREPYSVPVLAGIALQYGFRRQGAQTFIRISSNQPWEKLADEPLLRDISANLGRLGLTP